MRIKMVIEDDYNSQEFTVLYFKDLQTATKVMKIIFENDNDVMIILTQAKDDTEMEDIKIPNFE